MFEKNFDSIGVFVGYLIKLLEAIANFFVKIKGGDTSGEAETTTEAAAG